jgi:ABC-2 type transport system ATP-binding protein
VNVRAAYLRASTWAVTCVGALVVAPKLHPMIELGHLAPVMGILSGGSAFALLAWRTIPVFALVGVSGRRLVARSLVLTLKSAQEEAIWRGVLLGLLAVALGRCAGLVLSTVAFATAHVFALGRRAAVHLVTGAIFGATYVVTGSLAAAVASHATYNVLVGAGLLADQQLSVSASSGVAASAIRSRLAQNVSAVQQQPEPTASADARPVAELQGVRKAFGSVVALDNVDLELRRGEILGLLGPNGVGKSTAVALLLGLRRPDAGRAVLFGSDPGHAEGRRRIGVVLQDPVFVPTLRVSEHIDLVRAHFDRPVDREDLLTRLELTELSRRQAGGLSGGQRRRLALALALAGSPEALFLDEPTAALDAVGRRALWREVSTFVAGGGSVLLTTQHLEEAEQYATRLVLLRRGRVLLEGSVADVRGRAGRARVSFRAARVPAAYATAVAETALDHHVLYVDDADAFVGDLVLSGIPFRDLEVAGVSLEDAFVSLTGPDA